MGWSDAYPSKTLCPCLFLASCPDKDLVLILVVLLPVFLDLPFAPL